LGLVVKLKERRLKAISGFLLYKLVEDNNMTKLRELKKKLDLVASVVQYNEENGRYYANVDEEYRELRHLMWDRGILSDNYHYRWFDEAIGGLMSIINEDGYSERAIRSYEFNVQADEATYSLTEWLASATERVYFLTEAMKESEVKDGYNLLSIAQMIEAEEVYESARNILIEWLE